MNLGIKHLSKNITPETVGIIWLTDESLNYQSPGIYEFNYLLDGIVFKSLDNKLEKIKEENNKLKTNFFLGENFGTPLFIGHVVVEGKEDIKKMYDHIKISENFLKDDSKIYIYNRSKNTANQNILKILSEKYNQIIFENLNI